MRRHATCLLAALALLLGTSTNVLAQTVRLTAVLSGGTEAPTAVSTGAAGTAEVFVNVTTRAVTYKVDIFNMPTLTVAGHFHVGGPGVAGPIVIDLTPPAVTDDFSLSGSVSTSQLIARPANGIRNFDDFIQALVGGQVYVNMHSSQNPAGEIRGQLIPDRQ
jgi:hypothetical protein